MALKLFPIPFPILAPPPDPRPNQGASSPHRRPTTEVHFSRWYNANAEKFELRRRAQEEIEADIRRRRRFDAITNIVDKFDSYAETASAETFKSIGTPSDPSKPSIPGRKSKYSKPETRIAKLPRPKVKERAIIDRKAEIKISEDGLSYVVDGAPFEFKYSYTETPKVKPLKLREAPFAPFGPATMRRPWTGRVPHPAGKNKLRDFDSFVSPGPFPPGSGPRYVKTREEILGEPLTVEEIEELINGCLKSTRQLNMGRDGFTHNMLDNIHAHWKQRRVCKIKCRGVCTVDMHSVCQQLEEKTGGKIIYRKGGVLYLFRGRNYNYRFRPHFPLMWWRPIMPVYPRLIQRAPEGLTLEEATEMRRKGRKLLPICKLAKNGVYNNLLEHVREAFEECDLVRINCQGLNGSDYHKIGAKLKELVPCVLISFEHEHILMWRGRNWKSSFSKSVNECRKDNELGIYGATSTGPLLENQEIEMLSAKSLSISALDVNTQSLHSEERAKDLSPEATDDSYVAIDAHSLKSANKLEEAKGSSTFGLTSAEPTLERQDEMHLVGDTRLSTLNLDSSSLGAEKQGKDLSFVETEELYASMDAFPTPEEICEIKTALNNTGSAVNKCEGIDRVSFNGTISIDGDNVEMLATTSVKPYTTSRNVGTTEELQDVSEGSEDLNETAKLCVPQTDEVLQLWKQAVEEGIAVVLADADLDADTIYQKAIAFDQSAPPGPVFRHQPKPAIVQKHEQQESGDLEITKVMNVFKKGDGQRKGSEHRKTEELDEHIIDARPQGSLGVDKLAKLLA